MIVLFVFAKLQSGVKQSYPFCLYERSEESQTPLQLQSIEPFECSRQRPATISEQHFSNKLMNSHQFLHHIFRGLIVNHPAWHMA